MRTGPADPPRDQGHPNDACAGQARGVGSEWRPGCSSSLERDGCGETVPEFGVLAARCSHCGEGPFCCLFVPSSFEKLAHHSFERTCVLLGFFFFFLH